MAKEKLGRKDIFAPATDAGKTEEAEAALEKRGDPEQTKVRKARKIAERDVVPEAPRMVIHSFRMREDLVERVRAYAFFEKTKIYKVINQAVEEFLKGNKPRKHARPY